jgi:hypothetical protein
MNDVAVTNRALPNRWESLFFNNGRVPTALLLHGPNDTLNDQQMAAVASALRGVVVTLDAGAYDEPATDVISIRPDTSSIKVDAIKRLQERMKYGASSDGYGVVLIHQCQTLTLSSANALLKCLEEPPNNTVFVLSAFNKYAIPTTVRSRCQCHYVPESSADRQERMTALVATINEKITHVNVREFLAMTPLAKTIFIQSLPYDPTLIKAILMVWEHELGTQNSPLNQKELQFLDKMIEIIQKITYNLNLKLQLLAITLQLEESDF